MASGRIKAVVFDLDGTLLDTLGDLAASGNAVLRKRGLPEHETDAYRHFIGSGMSNLVWRIFPEDAKPAEGLEQEEVLADYKAEYSRRWKETTRLYDGIADLLDELEARGIALGVLSNKAHAFTEQCVEAFLGNWNWTVILGQRDGIPHKPDPAGAIEIARRFGQNVESCAFVGDSGVDMATGVASGMFPVGVRWGFRDAAELQEAGAEVLIERPGDLLDLL